MKKTYLIWILLFCILGSGTIIRSNYSAKHWLGKGDEGPWVRMASRFPGREFLNSRCIEHDLYKERLLPHPEDNRSPLFPILIAAVGVSGIDMFSAGKLLGVFIYIAGGILLFRLFRSIFGNKISILFIIFYSASPLCVKLSVKIYPDLLIAIVFLFYLFNISQIKVRARNSVISGIVVGLILLLKSTAVFLILPQVYYFWSQKEKSQFLKQSSLFILSIIITASPWLIRNIIVFGSPLYQFSSYLLFVDNGKMIFNFGVNVPSLGNYIESRGLLFLIFRPILGLKAMLTQFPKFDYNFSLALIPAALVGLWALKKRRNLVISNTIFLCTYLPLMSYIAYASWVDRYTVIFYFWIYLLAAIGIIYLAKKIKPKYFHYAIIFLLVAIPLRVILYPLEYFNSSRNSERPEDLCRRKAIKEIVRQVKPHTTIYSSYLQSYFQLHNFNVVNSNVKTLNENDFEKMAKIYKIEYLLLDSEKDSEIINTLCQKNNLLQLSESYRVCGQVLYQISFNEYSK